VLDRENPQALRLANVGRLDALDVVRASVPSWRRSHARRGELDVVRGITAELDARASKSFEVLGAVHACLGELTRRALPRGNAPR
jgi:hypothetical protein